MYNYSDLLLACQSALLNEVTPSLRGLAVEWSSLTLIMYFYHDGPMTDDLEQDYSCIATEVVANYCDAFLKEKFIQLDFPKPFPEHKHWVYKRNEGAYQNENESLPVSNNPYLVAQKVLLGKIPNSVKAIALEVKPNEVRFLFYVTSDSKELAEDCQRIVDSFSSYSKEKATCQIEVTSIRLPSLQNGQEWIFKRKAQ